MLVDEITANENHQCHDKLLSRSLSTELTQQDILTTTSNPHNNILPQKKICKTVLLCELVTVTSASVSKLLF